VFCQQHLSGGLRIKQQSRWQRGESTALHRTGGEEWLGLHHRVPKGTFGSDQVSIAVGQLPSTDLFDRNCSRNVSGYSAFSLYCTFVVHKTSEAVFFNREQARRIAANFSICRSRRPDPDRYWEMSRRSERNPFCQAGSILSRLWQPARRICLRPTTTITLLCSIDF
jgi:hypothetical protein